MSGQHCENYDVKREAVHCYPRNVDRCSVRDQRWPDVVARISARFSKFAFVLFCYITNHNSREQRILFPSNLNFSRTLLETNVSLDFVSENIEILGKQTSLLYSWRFSRYSAPIHWLVHGHMTCNNETVSRQMPWAGNIAKTMTSNGKQFTVTHEMLTAVSRDQRWPDVVVGISARFSIFSFVLFCYITNNLMTGP